MITLKEALKYSKEELENLKKELNEKAKKEKKLGAYIEQFLDKDLSVSGEGVPVAIKDNIRIWMNLLWEVQQRVLIMAKL